MSTPPSSSGSPDDGYSQYFPVGHAPPVGQFPPAMRMRGGTAKAGWIVLLVGLGVACIPGIGFLMWIIGGPVCFAGMILAIIGMAKGEVASGVMLLIASMVAAPLAFVVAPLVTAGLMHAFTGKILPAQQKMERMLEERGFPAPAKNFGD